MPRWASMASGGGLPPASTMEHPATGVLPGADGVEARATDPSEAPASPEGAEPPLQLGEAVYVGGASSSSDSLDGLLGICEDWDATSARWAVRLASGLVGRLPPDQLRRAPAARLRKVLFLNLRRRADRAAAQRHALSAAGLADLAERVPAVDGRELDLLAVPEHLLTPEGCAQALHHPAFVLGRVLTPGAVGLWLTWHKVLERIVAEAAPGECFLIVEDDAEYQRGVKAGLQDVLGALDAADPLWEACAVGYIRSKSFLAPLGSACEDLSGSAAAAFHVRPCTRDPAEVIGRLFKLCGASAILVHGAHGARSLLRALFPVGPNSQFDRKITESVRGEFPTLLHLYMSNDPLVAAPLSEAGDTDIQVIPEERRLELQREAEVRHWAGDQANAADPSRAQLLGSATFADARPLPVENRELLAELRSGNLDEAQLLARLSSLAPHVLVAIEAELRRLSAAEQVEAR